MAKPCEILLCNVKSILRMGCRWDAVRPFFLLIPSVLLHPASSFLTAGFASAFSFIIISQAGEDGSAGEIMNENQTIAGRAGEDFLLY